LKENTSKISISFLLFSRVASTDFPKIHKTTAGNIFAFCKKPYLKESEWGWQIDHWD